MNKEFNFVIAAKWPEGDSLCVYSYVQDVHYGDVDYAKYLLSYVKSEINKKERPYWKPKADDYKIYVLQEYKE